MSKSRFRGAVDPHSETIVWQAFKDGHQDG